MFRRLPHSLPTDPVPPSDLAGLGCFINEKQQIRLINDPDLNYRFKINRNDRYNELHQAALHDCIRTIVKARLLDLDLEIIRLPLGAGKTEPHVPIYVSKNLKNAKRILILFGQRHVDSGVVSFGAVGEDGLAACSVVDLVDGAMKQPSSGIVSDAESIGIVVTNPCQLIWYNEQSRAISEKQWIHLPRDSAVHGPFRIDPVRNRIPGNKSYVEHVEYIFDHVIGTLVRKDARLDIIGMEYTGMEVMQYLASHWNDWTGRVNGICLGNPQHSVLELKAICGNDDSFIDFVRKRARAYFISEAQIETPIAGIESTGCNCYASGESFYEDGILIKSWKSMLDWFNMISSVMDYEEPVFTLIDVETDAWES